MSDFLQQIIPPHFWIFVVLAALALHVVANYLQRLLDKSLSSGSVILRLRGVSKRGRENRAARVQQISDWIDGDGDRVTLALVEANFFCLLGFLLLLNAFVGFVAFIVTKPSRPFAPIFIGMNRLQPFIRIGIQAFAATHPDLLVGWAHIQHTASSRLAKEEL